MFKESLLYLNNSSKLLNSLFISLYNVGKDEFDAHRLVSSAKMMALVLFNVLGKPFK